MVETLLEVRQLSKTFRYRTGWFHRFHGLAMEQPGAVAKGLTQVAYFQ